MITIADAAEMLHARGITPRMVEEDHHAIQHLIDLRLGQESVLAIDLDAVRAALCARVAAGLSLIAEAQAARRPAAE